MCIDHWRRLSYLFLLFFGTLHSDAYIFPFVHCFSPLFFSQLFVRPSQPAILLLCISFPWGCSWSLSPAQCHKSLSFIESIFAWNVPLVSLMFLKRSLVFPILLFSSISLQLIAEKGFLISSCYSLEPCIQMLISFLFCFAFHLSSFHSYL